MDVLEWHYKGALSEFLRARRAGDTVWVHASPPCSDYSVAKAWHGEPADYRSADAMVKQALRIIRAAAPDYWTLENPLGALRKRPFMGALRRFQHLTSYCHWGRPFRKDTNIWTNVAVDLPVCRRGSECQYKRIWGRHAQYATDRERIREGKETLSRVSLDQLYHLPQRLCTHILRAALTSRTGVLN